MKRSAIIILLLLVLISAGVLYYLQRKAEAPAPGAPPSLLSLLPADASYVVYAEAAALRASPFVQQLLAALPSPQEDRDYAEFVRRTGFDYTRDLDRVAIAVSPGTTGTIAIAEGRFDRARIAADAAESGQRADRDGREAYLIPSQKGGKVLLVFLAENRILLTDRSDAAFLVTPKPSGTDQSSASPLQARIARVAASELFAVAHVSPLPTNLLPTDIVSGELKKTLESIQWTTLAVRSAPLPAAADSSLATRHSSLLVVLEAECTSAGDARKLAWSLEGLRVLARMALSDPKSVKGLDPALVALLETILKDGKISSVDRYVRLNFSLGPDFLTALRPQPSASPKKADH